MSFFLAKNCAWLLRGKNAHFPSFFRGVLGKAVCRTWFFCGQNVVECMVNMDKKLSLFCRLKTGHDFEIFFALERNLAVGMQDFRCLANSQPGPQTDSAPPRESYYCF